MSTRRLRERNFTKFARRRKQEDADDDGDGGTGRPPGCVESSLSTSTLSVTLSKRATFVSIRWD